VSGRVARRKAAFAVAIGGRRDWSDRIDKVTLVESDSRPTAGATLS
jgi:hypothetical protein